MSDDEKLQILLHERSIVNVMLKSGHSMDTKDWPGYASCFTDPVNINWKRFTGFDEVRVSASLFAKFVEVILSNSPCHHLMSNFKIIIHGDRAHASVDMIASLWTLKETGIVANRQYGWYDVWLVQEGEEWKISRMIHDFRGAEGEAAALEPEFAEIAQQVFSPANADAARVYLHQTGNA